MSDWTTLYGEALTAQLRHLAETHDSDTSDEEIEHALLRAVEEIEHLRRRETDLLRRVQAWNPLAR